MSNTNRLDYEVSDLEQPAIWSDNSDLPLTESRGIPSSGGVIATVFRWLWAVILTFVGLASLMSAVGLIGASFLPSPTPHLWLKLFLCVFTFLMGEVVLAFALVCFLMAARLIVGAGSRIDRLIGNLWQRSVIFLFAMLMLGMAAGGLALIVSTVMQWL